MPLTADEQGTFIMWCCRLAYQAGRKVRQVWAICVGGEPPMNVMQGITNAFWAGLSDPVDDAVLLA